ncbi:uncharacterized protein BDR25DRAFT_349181 [Lindgomyces ingoldianus]|uniref:Uncharacterized protein n=1 Tax=Lindgomyces ingoldianus TaxID=673940 RepID=A0ACB6RDM0_9PLEO|nr:uncharacterized protein BDR25DRAFT_349181 [Lindgomyces ingoldianus]KAF2477236.1 hypothetical protein BDR25DRAFT_349181 [Lindgomyces ingoldianus]
MVDDLWYEEVIELTVRKNSNITPLLMLLVVYLTINLNFYVGSVENIPRRYRPQVLWRRHLDSQAYETQSGIVPGKQFAEK